MTCPPRRRVSLARLLPSFVLLGLLSALPGCAFFSPAAPHKPVRFSEAPTPGAGGPYPNLQMPPALDFEDLSFGERDRDKVKLVRAEGAGAGTTGAEEHIVYDAGIYKKLKLKVKPMPGDLDGVNNAPRKELAAYRIQHLFLDPEDFVVPTTFPFCVPREMWGKEHRHRSSLNVKGLDCELTNVAFWVENATVIHPPYDEQRFLSDPTYAYYLSNLNVFTYVIGHRDGRKGNFLVSKDPARPQVFAIDNGSTFNPWGYNYFVPNYDVLRVAAVRKETVDRLRKLSRSDLDFLLVVAELEVGDDRIARQVRPGPSIDDDEGAVREGSRIQLGLRRKEIDKVWHRIQKLIGQADDGTLPVF